MMRLVMWYTPGCKCDVAVSVAGGVIQCASCGSCYTNESKRVEFDPFDLQRDDDEQRSPEYKAVRPDA